MDSILESIKKPLGLTFDDHAFDADVIMNINSAFTSLNLLGIGPADGFSISDASSTWVDFLGTSKKLESVKSYIYLKVKLIFDPPTSSFVLESVKNQITELEWKLNTQIEFN